MTFQFWTSTEVTITASAGQSLLPDSLSHEAVWVLGSEGGQQRPGRQTLLQFDGLGVGAEFWALVDVQDSYGDSCCGLTRQVEASSQRHLVLRLHRQHEGAVHLIIDGLGRRKEVLGELLLLCSYVRLLAKPIFMSARDEINAIQELHFSHLISLSPPFSVQPKQHLLPFHINLKFDLDVDVGSSVLPIKNELLACLTSVTRYI